MNKQNVKKSKPESKKHETCSRYTCLNSFTGVQCTPPMGGAKKAEMRETIRESCCYLFLLPAAVRDSRFPYPMKWMIFPGQDSIEEAWDAWWSIILLQQTNWWTCWVGRRESASIHWDTLIWYTYHWFLVCRMISEETDLESSSILG